MPTIKSPDNLSNRYRGNRSRALDCPEGIVERYIAGESELSLAQSLGVSRGPIRRWLIEAGVAIRGRSAAGVTRASRMTADERKAQVAAAHEAVRGTTRNPSTNLARAETIERKAVSGLVRRSDGEIELGHRLVEAGLHFVPEKAVAGYNLDFGISPVAVELLGGAWHASSERARYHAKRTEAVLNAGWSIIFVWSTNYMPLTVKGSENVVALVKKARRNPPASGQYWVIRGDGELMFTGPQGDDFSLKLPTQRQLRGRPLN